MDTNFFAQLQALSSLGADTKVLDTRKQLNQIVATFKALDDYQENVRIMAEEVRNLKVQTLIDCDSFMVQPDDHFPTLLSEELRHDALGFCKNGHFVFDGRYVYPVKDVKGDVMGFVGYDKFEETKYLDSRNHGYVAKQYSVWGEEMLPTYYKNDDLVFFVEGVVCALYLRQEGCQALATLGSIISPYVTEIIRRFGNRAIMINDADEAGLRCKIQMMRRIPTLRCIQSKIAKDVDDSRQVDDRFVTELKKLKNPFYKSPLFK